MNLFVDGIVFCSQLYGGVSRVWIELLKRFPALGVNTTVLLPKKAVTFLEQEGVVADRDFRFKRDMFYWPARVFDRSSVRRNVISKFYLDSDTNVFHSTLNSSVAHTKVKRVVTIHDLIPEMFREQLHPQLGQLLLATRRDVLSRADLIFADSLTTRNDLLNHFAWISEERVRVVYLAPSLHLKDLGSGDAEVTDFYLYVGKRGGYKNFDMLVELVASDAAYRKARFVCVGPAADVSTMQRLEQRGLTSNFVFVGNVSDDKLAAYYRDAIALVYPSKYEGFGLPILEAMSLGCPVVCSDIPVFREVAGDSAIFFSLSSFESLSEALKTAEARSQFFSEEGRRRAGLFSWDSAAAEIVRQYRNLLT